VSVRIQRQRTRGWRMPANATYIGRPSPWGNPWALGEPEIGTRPDGTPWDIGDVLRWYRGYAAFRRIQDPSWLDPLRGRDLACWCPITAGCHGDVLLQMLGERER
jgi:Domain of unknown function (DUF4326)